MGKGDRRHKLKPNGIPDLAPVKSSRKRRNPDGTFAKPAEDARITALAARCHHYGTTADKEGRAAMAWPWLSEPLGMVMQYAVDGRDDIARLWSVWQALCTAERSYSVRIIGRAGTPQGASLTMLPDRMEADQSHTVDLRTSEEKDRDAVNAWMRWRGYLGQINGGSLLLQVYRGEAGELWKDQCPTQRGLMALDALQDLCAVVEKSS